MGVAGGLIIAGCTSVKVQVPVARVLADASYSFYLLHLAVITALVNAGWSGWTAVFTALVTTLVASFAMFRFVERPTQHLGARLLRWRALREPAEHPIVLTPATANDPPGH